MAALMAQQGPGLAAPASRQDIVSALLNDYGNSFGRGDTSPVPTMKELPPPPPQKDDGDRKPRPSLGGLSMKFQLRVDEDSSPVSPDGSRKSPVEQPTRIVSRSLSRSSKPTSLRLLTSNGATAIPSPTPTLPLRKDSLPFSRPLEEKSLPPPPPPPEKSEKRRSQQQQSMASQQSQDSRSRKDSIQSQEAASQAEVVQKQTELSGSVNPSPIVKRKALPVVGLPSGPKKFVSLAQLQNGPRGGKGGPLPPAPGSRNASVDQGSDDDTAKITQATAPQVQERPSTSAQAEGNSRDVPALSQMPPTPEDDKDPQPPVPPRKAFAGGMGLPSNPRAKSSQEAVKHSRGKSSTGFDFIKAARPAPPPPAPVNTITPDLTPSPKRTEEVRKEQPDSPVSPLGANEDRPFSFEMTSAAMTYQQQQPQLQQPTLPQQLPQQQQARPMSPVSPPAAPPAQAQFPPRTTSRPSPVEALPRSTTPPQPAPAPAPALVPAPVPVPALVPSLQPTAASDDEDLPPFTPLTRAPLPQPRDLIAPITEKHIHCYAAHTTPIWSNNAFQPMGCMVCHSNDRDRKWSCAWCQLRICRECSNELYTIPGRKLDVLLKRRGVTTETEAEKEQDTTYDDDLLDDYEYDAREYDDQRAQGNTTIANPSVVVSDMDAGRDVDFS